MSPIVEAAGLLLVSRAEPPAFLLMQHPDRWDLPKGHAEVGEAILQTALRETEEETGIGPREIEVDPDFRYRLEYDVSGKKRGAYRKRVTYFLGYVAKPYSVTVSEHTGYAWLPWPATAPLQTQTIDPLLKAVSNHLARFPQRLRAHS